MHKTGWGTFTTKGFLNSLRGLMVDSHLKVKVTQSCSLQPCIVHGILQGSFSLLQGIFPSQGRNPGLPYCRKFLFFFLIQTFFFIYFFAYIYIYIYTFFFNWRLITLQYCGAFCHTFTWISHGCTCVPHPDPPCRKFFTSWATWGAQEYWSGSLSLLQWIFPTQESNQGLLHCW